ncbi:hypothetical protein BZA70DRAFT_287353 [Myxozyma melibiosi]|uniref:rRNA-processing protein FYV7 n=1 Tax=Myxozyma melibiosi TaxID=54550 RepID=A0ABR1FDU6_9ASCO
MSSSSAKGVHKPFRVPKSMPDGVHKRKLEKIKKTLTHNAEVKRSYRKTLKKMGLEVPVDPRRAAAATSTDAATSSDENDKEVKDEVDADKEDKEQEPAQTDDDSHKLHEERKRKLSRFKREEAKAAEVRAEREARQREQQRRAAERKEKLAVRERHKKKMMQYTQRGQPKLGPKVDVLLDRIRKQTAATS